MCLLTDVDATGLGGLGASSAAVAAAGSGAGGEGWGVGGGEVGLFEDGEEGGMLGGLASKVEEMLEQVL
jgi:hypothetical protein